MRCGARPGPPRASCEDRAGRCGVARSIRSQRGGPLEGRETRGLVFYMIRHICLESSRPCTRPRHSSDRKRALTATMTVLRLINAAAGLGRMPAVARTGASFTLDRPFYPRAVHQNLLVGFDAPPVARGQTGDGNTTSAGAAVRSRPSCPTRGRNGIGTCRTPRMKFEPAASSVRRGCSRSRGPGRCTGGRHP